MKIIAFHGSPGSPADFAPLKAAFPEGVFVAPARPGYERFFSGDSMASVSGQACVVVGYSWGAIEALRFAAESGEKIKAVLLVSAYLFPKAGASSAVTNFLIGLPGVGSALVAKKAPAAMDQMLVKTSSPDPVPPAYRDAARTYARPDVLRQAVLEKADPLASRARIFSWLKALSDRKIPISALHGDSDQTGSHVEQIGPIRDKIALNTDELLPRAGHALIWTRPEKVVEILRKFEKD